MSMVERLLTDGLLAGYGGETVSQVVRRGPFPLKSSQFISPEGGVYEDEWMAKRSGGGQEIAQHGEDVVTRLYAGGVVKAEDLQELGITEEEVIAYLKRKINELGGRTRLYEDCSPGPDGDWRYFYKIKERVEAVSLVMGLEMITYKNQVVFAHGFLLSPVE